MTTTTADMILSAVVLARDGADVLASRRLLRQQQRLVWSRRRRSNVISEPWEFWGVRLAGRDEHHGSLTVPSAVTQSPDVVVFLRRPTATSSTTWSHLSPSNYFYTFVPPSLSGDPADPAASVHYKKYPNIRRYFAASFPHFNGTVCIGKSTAE